MRSTKDGHLAQAEPEVEFAISEVPETHDYNLVAEALDFGDPDSWLPLATVEATLLVQGLWTVLPHVTLGTPLLAWLSHWPCLLSVIRLLLT